MALKTIVKVSQISNLSDARYCAGMGVEMLGFQAIPGSGNYVTPEIYQDIRGWISGPKIIAELYGLSDPAQVDEVIQTYAPDYFELTYAQYAAFSKSLSLPCMIYHPSGSTKSSIQEDDQIVYCLMDEDSTCKDIAAAGLPVLKKITSLQSLNQVLADGCFKGIVLEGPKQWRTGVTNHEQLGAILEALEETE